jgi:hypothetical protein
LSNSPNAADWITAGATVFAAVGTVGAVIVALGQSRAATRRSVDVTCRVAVMAPSDTETVEVISLRATNDGLRPIKLDQAYLETDDGHQVFCHFYQPNEYQTFTDSTFPRVLDDGESMQVYWQRDRINKVANIEGITRYRAAYFTDPQGNTYKAAFPGAKQRRRWTLKGGFPRRRVIYVLPGEPRSGRFRFPSKKGL